MMDKFMVSKGDLHVVSGYVHSQPVEVVFASDADAEIKKAFKEGRESASLGWHGMGYLKQGCQCSDCEPVRREIEKARREGVREGERNVVEGRCSTHFPTLVDDIRDKARADEREECARSAWMTGLHEIAKMIRSRARGERKPDHSHDADVYRMMPKEPKPLEKLTAIPWRFDRELFYKFNALADAVNELRSLPPLGTRLAGGTKIGNAVTLPNGGTWERIQ